jgi:hypothetical protein
VPLAVYDRTIRVLRDAVDRAKLGNEDRLTAVRELDRQARQLELTARKPEFLELVERERACSADWGGRSV